MKTLIIGFFALFTLNANAESTVSTVIERDSIIHYAQQFLGTPYKYGGSSTSGFDCSGFVHYVFTHFNISVPRSSSGFKGVGKEITMPNAHPGDVILFTGTNSSVRQIGHVGIVYQNKDGVLDFIHSSSSSNHWGVTISRYNGSGYEKRFMGVINLLS